MIYSFGLLVEEALSFIMNSDVEYGLSFLPFIFMAISLVIYFVETETILGRWLPEEKPADAEYNELKRLNQDVNTIKKLTLRIMTLGTQPPDLRLLTSFCSQRLLRTNLWSP